MGEVFSPTSILAVLRLDRKIKDVVEFGCGYGTFTIPSTKSELHSPKMCALNTFFSLPACF